MKIFIRRMGLLILLLLAVGTHISVAQSPIPENPDFSWLNGNWESRTKILTMEIKVVNGNELAGTASFNYGGGWAHGQLYGKVSNDVIHITVKWQRGTSGSYEFHKRNDGSLLGVITEGGDLGLKVMMTKS